MRLALKGSWPFPRGWVEAADGTVTVCVPYLFGRRRITVPVDQVDLCTDDPSDDHDLRVVELSGGMEEHDAHDVFLLLRQPLTLPPLKWWRLVANNVSDLGVLASRRGIEVDAVGLGLKHKKHAREVLLSAGLVRVKDLEAWQERYR